MMNTKIDRREFLRTTAAASVAAALAQPAWSQTAKPARVGVIGVGSRGTGLLSVLLSLDGVEVPAICDIDRKHLDHALDLVEKARGKRPAGYSAGATDYRRLLQRDDLDAVLIATPMQLHAVMSVDALRAKKHVLSEVAAAMTMDECWALVRATEETGRIYMMSENCCYFRQNMAVMQMVQAGLFGDITYAECGYVHDCRALKFNANGSLTWRGEMSRDFIGNLYPTHSFGPVCWWLGINRGDRLVSLTASMTPPQRGLAHYVTKRFGADSPASKVKWQAGDSTTALIRTAKGAVIELRYDICSARPHVTTVYYTLQGTTASYEDRNAQQQVWVDGKSKSYAWEPFANYQETYDHPLWKRDAERASKTGHGGADYFAISEFIETVRSGRAVPVDVYDAATWSAVIPLTAASIRAGGAPQKFPDFTRGAWEKRARA